MLKINEIELNEILHEILRIVSILKAIENGHLSEGQRQIIHGCETRLNEVRQEILQSIEHTNNNKGESK